MKNKNKDKVVLYSFIIISTLTFILFFQYIIGNKTFFSMRVISDGIMQFYPNHVEFARVLKKRVFGTFSWTHGWGGYIFDSNPFSLLMVSFGENRIIYMTGIIVVVKTIIAGFCFSLYLKELKIEKKVNIIYSIFYALSVQVVCGGCIQSLAELAIILAIFLYAIEKFRNKKNLGAFFFGAILTVLCLQLYIIITMCAFLIAYIIATNYY